MIAVHPAQVAGTFYPAEAVELRASVEEFLAQGRRDETLSGRPPKALIVPHAGYEYSGPVAGSGYAALVPGRDTVRRVVLFGTAHRLAFAGLATSSVECFRVPLGDVPIDGASAEIAVELPEVRTLDAAFNNEHSLEVQLPFLQVVLKQFSVVPLLVGRDAGPVVATVMETLWDGPDTVFVISSDLSHYLPYDEATARDRATATAIERLEPDRIGRGDACGYEAIRGLLRVAAERRLKPRCLDLRNSGDTSGGRERVVGYGAFAFHVS